MTQGVFVTGTDTGIGKTWTAAGLIAAWRKQGLRVAGFKPVAAGCEPTDAGLRNEDAVTLIKQGSVELPYEWVNPYAFLDPIAPHLAAAAEGVRIDVARIQKTIAEATGQLDRAVVEGIGGWAVPLNETETTADLAQRLGFPVILVVGIRLGCLNHALLTAESVAQRRLHLAGWVANAVDPDCPNVEANITALEERIPAPLLGWIPYRTSLDAHAIAPHLDMTKLDR